MLFQSPVWHSYTLKYIFVAAPQTLFGDVIKMSKEENKIVLGKLTCLHKCLPFPVSEGRRREVAAH